MHVRALSEADAGLPAPATNASVRVVEVGDRLVDRLLRLHLRNLDPSRAQVQVIAYQVGVQRVLDPELDRYAQGRRHLAEGGQPLLVVGCVLAVHRHEVVGAGRHERGEVVASYGHGHGEAEHVVPAPYPLLQVHTPSPTASFEAAAYYSGSRPSTPSPYSKLPEWSILSVRLDTHTRFR